MARSEEEKKYYETIGRIYELFVKRGLIAGLVERNMLQESLLDEEWQEISFLEVMASAKEALSAHYEMARRYGTQEAKTNAIEALDSVIEYLFLIGQGHGLTVMRRYLGMLDDRHGYRVEYIWAPPDLAARKKSGAYDNSSEGRSNVADRFRNAFGLSEARIEDSRLVNKGCPARSDFMMLLTSEDETERHLFVAEISLNAALVGLRNFNTGKDVLELSKSLAATRREKGVFSMLRTELTDDSITFDFNENLKNHLTAFSSEDKPLYKLCQAASYATNMSDILQKCGISLKTARAVAITSESFESILIDFSSKNANTVELAKKMGEAYRKAEREKEDGYEKEDFDSKIKSACRAILYSLPKDNGAKIDEIIRKINETGNEIEPFAIKIKENPKFTPQSYVFSSIEEITGCIDEEYSTESACHYEQEKVKKAFNAWKENAIKEIKEIFEKRKSISLRDVHASAIKAFITNAPPRVRLLGLPGSPGIGKTTAIRETLKKALEEKENEGFMFFYFSPRVVINRDVFNSMSGKGCVAISTDYEHIKATRETAEALFEKGMLCSGQPENYSTMVLYETEENINIPKSSTLYLKASNEEMYSNSASSGTIRKRFIAKDTDKIEDKNFPSVMNTLASATVGLLKENENIKGITITSSIQAFRATNRGTTIKDLMKIFDDPTKICKRFKTIVVMVDELTGDSAGPALIRELIISFEEVRKKIATNDSPRIIIVLADASMTNDRFLQAYLNDTIQGGLDSRSPARLLVGKGHNAPFNMSITSIRVGNAVYPIYNVMANCFPAAAGGLCIDYDMVLDVFETESTKKTIKELKEKRLSEACDAIAEELKNIGKDGQVIYFVQNKEFLSELKNRLCNREDIELKKEDIIVITSKISQNDRRILADEEQKNSKRVVLMTSSAARGISFPNARAILAEVPRFMVENAFMEIVQLIYRGRGRLPDGRSGDDLQRKLRFFIKDYIIAEGTGALGSDEAKRRWLRVLSDMVTVQALLRASIYTRMNGDTTIRGKNMAVVPVGENKVEGVSSEISSKIKKFIVEARDFIAKKDKENKESNGLVETAKLFATGMFTNMVVSFERKKGKSAYEPITPNIIPLVDASIEGQSSQNPYFGAWKNAQTRELFPCSEDSYGKLPKEVEVVANIFTERLGFCRLKENFTFNIDTKIDAIKRACMELNLTPSEISKKDVIESLKMILARAIKDQKIEKTLRDASEDLLKILDRDKNNNEENSFSVFKNSKGEFFVAASIWRGFEKSEEAIRKNEISSSDAAPASEGWNMPWLDALRSMVWAGDGFVAPILPNYKNLTPWILCRGDDPWRADVIFNNKFFAASSELNLLNMIL